MKIVHMMLCGPVTDGWSYQDNLLTKYHRKLGYDVTMITSQWVWGENGNLLKEDRVSGIKEKIGKLINNPRKYNKMKQIAEEKGMETFSYKRIAERALK